MIDLGIQVETPGLALRVARTARGLSISDAAASVGICGSYLSQIESGSIERIGRRIAEAISREFGIDAAVWPSPFRRGPKVDENRSSLVEKLRENGVSLGKIGDELKISRQRVDQLLNPIKRQARSAVMNALYTGELVRPKKCESCGKGRRPIEAHHEDYSKPLAVIWLCLLCHKQADRALRLVRRAA